MNEAINNNKVNTISFESENHALRNFEVNFLMAKRCRNFTSEVLHLLVVVLYNVK